MTPIRPEPPNSAMPPQKETVFKGASEKVAKAASDVNHLLGLPNDLRQFIVSSLTEKDLDALEISLSKGDAVQTPLKPALKHLKDLIAKTRQNLTYQNLLKDHPDWKKKVESWTATLEEKIWLMRIYELALLDVKILGVDSLSSYETLLKNRDQVTQELEKVKEISWNRIQSARCPSSICLLVNLEGVGIYDSKITEPPDLSLNKKLKELYIQDCKSLTRPPNLRHNKSLTFLNLKGNSLTKPPNLEENVNLEVLILSENNLTESPNLTNNTKLKTINLQENKLTIAPDVSMLKNLSTLTLGHNQIVEPPDVRGNPELISLFMEKCGTQRFPDLTQNPKFLGLDFRGNSVSDEEKKKFEAFAKERSLTYEI